MRHLPLVLVALIFTSSARAQREFGFDNRKPSGQPYLKPAETVARMKVADGFEVKLFAAEPDVVNPIAMTVDEKGRVWVIECFEYPKRTPKGKTPRDRIVILEDTDGDGVCDKRTVFAEGKDFPVPFDLASSLEVGYGGVYVGAPPYLFFIENKNDKPGKFEVLLKGFGSQDTHETLNTFQWGPDGWLYGLHGVFTQSEVKPEQADGPGTRLNAAVWRLHPKTKKFEIFSEGTSNPWGMDWRNTDGQFILCCCVIPHLYHMVPGGIYRRQGGQSFNPYAYGEIKEICDHTFHKESGWAHAGLISLDTPLMPEKYRNSVIFGSIHGCSLKQNILKPNGSTYTASRGEDFLVSGDKNFRPINLRWGHNGEIYCIDWHDQNPCHQAGQDSWDYEHGRVYRVQPKGLKTKKAEDFGAFSFTDLLRRVPDQNPYTFRTCLRLLAERKPLLTIDNRAEYVRIFDLRNYPSTFLARLVENITIGTMIDTDILPQWLALLCDANELAWQVRRCSEVDSPPVSLGTILATVAKDQKSIVVRRELASAAVTLSERVNVQELMHELIKYGADVQDPIVPQLIWIAFEKMGIKFIEADLIHISKNCAGNRLITDTIIPRVMRRLVATGNPEELAACVKFLTDLKDATAKQRALEGLVLALQGRQVDAPAEWKAVRAALAQDNNKDIQSLVAKLAINFRDPEAVKRALNIAIDARKSAEERVQAIRDLGLAKPQAAEGALVKLATSDTINALRIEAIRALGSFDSPTIARDLLTGWDKLPRSLKDEIVNVLAGRKAWARQLLDAVGAQKVARTDLNVNTIQRMLDLKDKTLDQQIDKVWGRFRKTPGELNALINQTRNQLGEARASFARGKIAFDNYCAKCHKFEGRGFEVGPDIEGAARDIEYLLANVLDPNRVIGAPYFIRTVSKLNGQNETGLLHAEDDQSITLKTENAVLKVIQKKDIENVRIQEKSLMPEGFGSNIKIQEFRDLIRYTMANPFIAEVFVYVSPPEQPDTMLRSQPAVGVTGRIPSPIPNAGEYDVKIQAAVTAPESMKTKLLLGIRDDFKVTINGKAHQGKGSGTAAQPDQVSVDVELAKGDNKIEISFRSKNKGDVVYARFLDPDRKLRYPEPKD